MTARALVIGAGVAGPVAAMALQKAGLDVVVYEAHPEPADEVGAFLTLQVNGVHALRAIDADRVVDGLGFPTPVMRFRSGTGKPLGEVELTAAHSDGPVSVTLRRADLYRALCDEAVRRGIRIEYGRRLRDAHPVHGGVRAEFADGSVVTGDVLVGADGVRSRVRHIIDPAAAPARYVPMLNIGGYAPPQDTGAPPGAYEMVFGKRAFFGYAVAPDGEIWWFANPPRRDEPAPGELAAMTTEQWRTWLLELFADDRSPACTIIASTPGELTGWAVYDVPSVRHWHRDGMVIIGDAAHATSPSSGQGASLAIEDAVELGRCLRDLPDPTTAFAAYEHLRRSRVEQVVALGARTSSTKVAGPVARVLRDLFMPIFVRKTGTAAQRQLYDYRIDWSAPVAADPAVLAAVSKAPTSMNG